MATCSDWVARWQNLSPLKFRSRPLPLERQAAQISALLDHPDGNGRRLEGGHMASFYRVTHTRRNYVQAVVPSTVNETQMRYA